MVTSVRVWATVDRVTVGVVDVDRVVETVLRMMHRQHRMTPLRVASSV